MMKRSPLHRYLRFWRADVEDDVDEELRFHLEMRERDYVTSGLSTNEAKLETARRFGNVDSVRALCYEIGHQHERSTRIADFVQGVRNDVVFAARQLARNPGFTVAAVVTLALGIGANALVFGFVNAVLLRPFPGVRSPDRLISVGGYSVSYPSYRDFRDGTPALAGLAAFSDRGTAVSDGTRTIVASVGVVSGNYFNILGVMPSAGRLLTPADDEAGAAPAAVLSRSFARTFFPDDASPVGRTIDLNGSPVKVVGVAASDFRGTEVDASQAMWISIHCWMDLAPASFAGLNLEKRGWGWLTMIGRLAPGASLQSATTALNASAAQQERAFPDHNNGFAKDVASHPPSLAADAAVSSVPHGVVVRSATVILVIVAIVLLIACANVSNLLLARAMSRRREIAVRMAVGAGRGRMIRQLLTETAVLAIIAAVVGLLATVVANRYLAHVSIGDDFSFSSLGAHVDTHVTVYTISIALVASMIFGVAPAFQGTNDGNMTVALKDGSPGGGRSASVLRRSLLVAQIALSLILLIGAGLFTRSLQRALAADPGFDGSHVATARINVGLIPRDSARVGAIYDELIRRLQNTPGVHFAAMATALPLDRGSDSERFRLDDYIPPPGPESDLELADVTPGFFQAFSIPLLSGRRFGDQDAPGTQHVAIINETMARQYWKGREPLGRRVLLGGDTVTIVGVVRDSKYHDLGEPPQRYLYRVLGQHLGSSGLFPQQIVVRGSGNASQLVPLLRKTIGNVAPEVPVSGASTFDESTGHVVFAQRLGAIGLGLFGLLALAMTSIGIYGVVGYGVTQRTREIGVRIALGARSRSVLALVLTENLSTIVLGLVLGGALSVLLTRAISGFLFGVSALDGVTFAGATITLLIVGLAAALPPALRASHVDPAVSLRGD
ncbi:MAG: ABC transporter permease [Gemmatimonadaceae bacterium]